MGLRAPLELQWDLRIPLKLQHENQCSSRVVAGNSGFLPIWDVLRVSLKLQWGLISSCIGVTHPQQGCSGGLLSCYNVRMATH